MDEFFETVFKNWSVIGRSEFSLPCELQRSLPEASENNSIRGSLWEPFPVNQKLKTLPTEFAHATSHEISAVKMLKCLTMMFLLCSFPLPWLYCSICARLSTDWSFAWWKCTTNLHSTSGIVPNSLADQSCKFNETSFSASSSNGKQINLHIPQNALESSLSCLSLLVCFH